MDDDKIRLLSGLPLSFENRFIDQVKLADIINIGVENYYNKCFPFLISLEFLGIDSDQGKDFDLFWVIKEKVLGEKYLMESLVEGLVFFFKTENIKLNPDLMEIIIYDEENTKVIEKINGKVVEVNKTIHVNETVINRDNFNLLTKKIMSITKTERLKGEKKENKNLSEKAKRYYELRQKYEKANKKEENLTKFIYDMVDFLVHYQDTLNYKNVLELTMYQATNSLNKYNRKETFKINLNSYFAGAKVSKKELKHWAS